MMEAIESSLNYVVTLLSEMDQKLFKESDPNKIIQ